MQDEEPLYGIRKVAELAGLKHMQVGRWVEQKRLAPAQIGDYRGRPQPLYRLSDVLKLKDERGIKQ